MRGRGPPHGRHGLVLAAGPRRPGTAGLDVLRGASALLLLLVACHLVAAAGTGEDEDGLPQRADRYLVAGTWNNLNNQRQSVFRGLVTAKELGLIYVLPHWHLNYYDYPPYGVAVLVPFDYFYDVDALAKHASASGYRLARHLPPHLVPRCFTQLQHSWALGQSVHTHQPAGGGAEVVVPYNGVCPAVGNVSAALLSWAEAGGVACVPTICSFHLQASGDDFKYAGLRRGFKVSSLFEDEVAAVLDELERRYGTRQYIAVHARTEEDWADNCPKSELTWTRGWYCYVSDWNLTQVLMPKQAEGTLIFLATGDPLSAFPHLCSRYRCWKRETLKPVLGPGIVDRATSRAFIDLQLATRASFFYGNRFSTFSVEVNEEAKQHNYGRTAPDGSGAAAGRVEWYNPKWPEGYVPKG